VLSYAGWNSNTNMPTGPTQVARQDRANGYTTKRNASAAWLRLDLGGLVPSPGRLSSPSARQRSEKLVHDRGERVGHILPT
jgi:hypothetical protein